MSMNYGVFFVSLLLAVVGASSVLTVPQGNCYNINMKYKQSMCVHYGGVLESTNMTATVTLQSGATTLGFFISEQPNCNLYHSNTGDEFMILPGGEDVTVEYSFTGTPPPMYTGVLLACHSVKSCVGFMCSTFSPYYQMSPMPALIADLPNDALSRNLPVFANELLESSSYVSFQLTASATQSGSDCLSFPVVTFTTEISCSEGLTPLLTYNSDQVISEFLYFKQCSGNSIEFQIGEKEDNILTVPLEQGAFNSSLSCMNTSTNCCQNFAVKVFTLITN